MKSLYELKHRKVGFCTFVSVICQRGNISVQSSEKAIPPIIEYDAEGNFKAISAKQVLQGLHFHPYKPNSKDFNEARLADLEVSAIFKQLEHFPTLPIIYEGENSSVHPVAELLYSNVVYLKPNAELDSKLSKLSYIKKSALLPKILEKVAAELESQNGIKIDLFSVPKRKVGTFAYLADEDGISKVAKLFSFGMHKIIPADRIARELSSLKACEKFLNPVPVYDIPLKYQPFVSMLRVAIVGTEFSMLDSGDLFESALPKIACRLSRKKIEKDLLKIPSKERNLVFRPFRSGIEVYHEEETFLNEQDSIPGTIRLIFPGGVKVASQYTGSQAKCSNGENVDILLGFDTFSKKGALACFLYDQNLDFENISVEEAIQHFKNMPKEKIFLNGVEYEGYIVNLPVMRPGQRYTELSKASNNITVDLISKAILKKKYKVSEKVEKEYQSLRSLRASINREINSIIK